MATKLPRSVENLLAAGDSASAERAWAEFLQEFSNLILHVARFTQGDHDSVMDRYVFVLDALRHDNYRRLRAYSQDGRGSFTTWLVAVVRRLSVDEHRRRYGRSKEGGPTAEQLNRRQLADLLSTPESLESLEFHGIDPDSELEAADLKAALDRALSGLEVADRLLLRLRYEDGLPVPEIAQLLSEESPFRVYRRIDKILGILRRELELAGIGGSTP